tara:strand:- start:15197 stop:16900 length:1704 start_codon:yes stop_codon:yes gene_type:complete
MVNPVPKKYPLWSIYYDDEGYSISGNRIMGRQAAGWSFLNGLIKDRPERFSAYVKNDDQKNLLVNNVKSILAPDQEMELNFVNYSEPQNSESNGGIFVPGPGISPFCNQRSYHGHDRYSLVGITHTTASLAVMDSLASLVASDVMPWDAIICTSECVLDTVTKVIDNRFEKLQSKLSIKNPIYPKFPVIPLGLDKDEFDYSNNFKAESRKSLGIGIDDIVIVYVGRISFHAKAHHLPMYLALEQCSQELNINQKIHIIQTGWFANDFTRDVFVNEGKQICPSVEFHFLDGKDQANKHLTLSSGDIFISLSDNIQETFGLTPIEGMAAGLAVLVSDWNGYKSTVRQNIDGFRVNTVLLEKGFGEDLAYDQMMEKINYDYYIGMSVQRVAIDIKDCINKLTILIKDKVKREKFGKSGRTRIKENFNWPVILHKYRDLATELDSIRIIESKNYEKFCLPSLPSNALDPFDVFSSYPTDTLTKHHKLYKVSDINNMSINDLLQFKSINYSINYLPPNEEFEIVYSLFNDKDQLTIDDILNETILKENNVFRIIIWLLKFGYLSLIGEKDEN